MRPYLAQFGNDVRIQQVHLFRLGRRTTAKLTALRHRDSEPAVRGEQKLFERRAGSVREPPPFFDWYQHRRFHSTPRHYLRAIAQTGIQKFTKARLRVLNWPNQEETFPTSQLTSWEAGPA